MILGLDSRHRARDAAAYDAMRAARPLRPPPLPLLENRHTAAAVEAANDARREAGDPRIRLEAPRPQPIAQKAPQRIELRPSPRHDFEP